MDHTGNAYDSLEPGVIDEDMIKEAMYEQGPKGEAGRLAKEEGISYDEVFALRLEFKSKFGIQKKTTNKKFNIYFLCTWRGRETGM